jgi:hypothetical protein
MSHLPSFFFFPLWVQGATSIRLSEHKILCWHWTCPKYNHGRASSIILGQIRSKAYGINYGVHVTYVYIITTFWFLISRTQLAISHTFSNWAPMSLQIISQSPLLELLVLSSFWFWSNILKAFDRLWWVRFCISWLAKFYVCNFVTLFVVICQLINLEW